MTRTYIKGLAVIAMFLSLTASNASAANSIDLTTKGSSATGTAANDAEITWIAQQTSISSKGNEGVLDSFVRLRAEGDNTSEQGYNTDARPLQFDEKKNPNVTRSLELSEVPVVNIEGVNYRQFVLEINQKKEESLLSLNQVQIFLRNAGNLDTATVVAAATSTTPPAIDFLDLVSTEVFRLNNGDDPNFTRLNLNAALNPKRKPGDYFFYVEDSAFQAVVNLFPDQQFVYLYSQFGTPPDSTPNRTTPDAFPANGKFEEWAVLKNAPNPVPEPTSVALVLTGLGTLGLARLRRRHRSE